MGCVTLEVRGVCLLGAAFFFEDEEIDELACRRILCFFCVSEAIIP